MHKKAQFWYSDFLLAVLILIAISFLFINNITNLNSKQDKLQVLSSDGIAISNSFMSEGYCPPPRSCGSNWVNLEGRIGFVKEGRVLENNLKDLINLVRNQEGYEDSKILLGTKNNYIFFFEDENGKIQIQGDLGDPIYGKWDIDDISDIQAESLVKITRIVYLDNSGITKKLVRLVIIVW